MYKFLFLLADFGLSDLFKSEPEPTKYQKVEQIVETLVIPLVGILLAIFLCLLVFVALPLKLADKKWGVLKKISGCLEKIGWHISRDQLIPMILFVGPIAIPCIILFCAINGTFLTIFSVAVLGSLYATVRFVLRN